MQFGIVVEPWSSIRLHSTRIASSHNQLPMLEQINDILNDPTNNYIV